MDRTKDEESSDDHSFFHDEDRNDYNNGTAPLLNENVPRQSSHAKHAVALQLAKNIFVFLLPCWIRSSGPTTQTHAPQKVHKTLWLDGLRGIASVLVMFHHSRLLWYPELGRGYASVCAIPTAPTTIES